MLTAFVILLWLIVGLLALVLVLICIPVHLKMTFRSDPVLALGLELRLLSGRAPRLVFVESGQNGARRKKTDAKPEKPKPKKKRQKAKRGWVSKLRPVEMARAIPALLGDTLSAIHVDRLRVQAEFGLGDPADTGRVFGQLTPLAYSPLSPAISIAIKPNFETVCLKGRAEAAFHFIPIRLAVPAMRFAWRHFVVAS